MADLENRTPLSLLVFWGQTTLTFTPRSAPSTLSAFERPTTPYLLVVYEISPTAGMRPAADAVFTIWPDPCFTIIR